MARTALRADTPEPGHLKSADGPSGGGGRATGVEGATLGRSSKPDSGVPRRWLPLAADSYILRDPGSETDAVADLQSHPVE